LHLLHPFVVILAVLVTLQGTRSEDAREVVDLKARPERLSAFSC
jgi:hypothetical protein